MQAIGMRRAIMVAGVVALTGCATVTTPTKGDPFESYNRTMFTINDTVDQYAVKPVAKGYVWLVPEPVRNSVTNFFSNIGDVYIAANNLAQLKIADGVSDIMRVAINTLFGVGGLFDVATIARLPKHSGDFGLTLGHYGVPSGPYVVLPLLGPSTVRDSAGLVVDYFGNPLTYVSPDSVSWALYGVNLVNVRANLLGATDVLADAALDKYSFVRNAYLQRRQYLISGGDGSMPDYGEAPLPNYGDEGTEGASATAAPAAAASAASGTAAAPAPASGSANTVPGNQYVPPRAPPGFPSFRLR
ncbi:MULTISPECIES: VacJ family lipoprotein [Caballeronia]|jgi:phospholipid-binding lipoprotein MlaA|uniref:ABC transporter n=1 Tax=Caballeronia zhejiangensis TaxID=871203 RepID=A0A656QG74_9BURK|nr:MULTISPECIES: VacJ family lipoprotein [Caballeronia]EKS72367.1 VacJ family lipoprotein [Burkholderia sp. SJ98]KDR27865.1 ABC transporter [Caballeronia zhejiangensis]MCG7404848.1 VacJ family lipoprotein [Caballeronia zhejiangensis]MCI1046601.1 VacJ family lipoprotein [Caballeronia zhejiangensis]MDR5766321.1 VacJ family lipoprotein [Caballeronia sp. LZ028]